MYTPFKNRLALLSLFALLCLPVSLSAQLLGAAASDAKETVQEVPKDSLGRDNPRSTVDGFLNAMGDQNYNRASQYLTLRRSVRRSSQKKKVVQAFQRLLDTGGDFYASSLLSNKATGRTDDDLEPNTDQVGKITVGEDEINLYVENTAGEGKPPVWRFTQETVDDVTSINIKSDLLIDKVLPASMRERRLWGVPVGHWLAVIAIGILSYLVAWGLISLLGTILSKFWKKEKREKATAIIQAFEQPVRLYLAVRLFVAVSLQVGISIIVRQKFNTIIFTATIFAFLILLWRLTDYLSIYTQQRMTLRKRLSAISVILFLRRMAKIVIVVIGVIAVLSAVGFDVTTWLAALGIGGIALALGAQKTVENFVGSVTLIADQPIRVGDFCKVGEIKGTVESIGMRSTRLRTPERTIVTIPNGLFSSNNIENYAHRDKFFFNPVLEFRMETTPAQLRYLLVEIRTMFYSHPKVSNEPAKVRFGGLTASGYKIEINAYIEAPNIDTAEEVEEDLYLRILDIVAASGTDFAYPSQTLYMARDKGIDEDKTRLAAEKVQHWVDTDDLQLPAFDPERIEALKDKIQYPPKGSISAKEE
ncbi:mechanosensitive ion channel protein MscS [Flavobacterium akiainvivens]|uniref:Mechanosensitive ion channel protein MscS n=1 Tax=Flavobacterium akiainvivens TaxID=1202724 RepID=A0A0M8M7Z4_9FLAO|nr:mechanosensitive ion channel family protein [Flavobacterium akiainvivens]KOS05343.1 mechanosensitive ion channel protein MscS [Flavobacterium akiainvivens]SFQ76729.1 MscS family membrane protein [Flavobacterium akiainvivens]